MITLMLLRERDPLPVLVIVKQSGPAVCPNGADPKLIRLGLTVGAPAEPEVVGTGAGVGVGAGAGAGGGGAGLTTGPGAGEEAVE